MYICRPVRRRRVAAPHPPAAYLPANLRGGGGGGGQHRPLEVCFARKLPKQVALAAAAPRSGDNGLFHAVCASGWRVLASRGGPILQILFPSLLLTITSRHCKCSLHDMQPAWHHAVHNMHDFLTLHSPPRVPPGGDSAMTLGCRAAATCGTRIWARGTRGALRAYC